jgi:hypothetical protein
MKTTNGSNSSKGPKQGLPFFFGNAAKTNATKNNATKNNENNMGLSSNLKKSAIKKTTQHGTKRSSPAKKAAKRQIRMDDTPAAVRCDEGTTICRACEKLVTNPNFKNHAHDKTCERNSTYKESNGGRKSERDMLQEKLDEERVRELTRPFEGSELHSLETFTTQADVDTFLKPSRNIAPAPTQQMEKAVSNAPLLSRKLLKEKVSMLMQTPSSSMKRAAFEVLLEFCSIQCKKNSNTLMV